MANTLSACIELYQDLVHGEMPTSHSITKVADNLYDKHVAPTGAKFYSTGYNYQNIDP